MASDALDDVADFERECGLPHGFYQALLGEDDWSFVIKLHALVEAAISHVLAAVCARPELVDTFARLELSNATTGKLAFAKALACVDEEDRRFTKNLSEIRNAFVHDVRNARMNLALYLATFDKNQLRKFREAFGPRRDPFVVGTFSIPQEQFVRENPKLSMWLRGIYVIAFAQLEKEKAKLRVGQAEVAAIRNYLSSPPGA